MEIHDNIQALSNCIVDGITNRKSRPHYDAESVAELIQAQVTATQSDALRAANERIAELERELESATACIEDEERSANEHLRAQLTAAQEELRSAKENLLQWIEKASALHHSPDIRTTDVTGIHLLLAADASHAARDSDPAPGEVSGVGNRVAYRGIEIALDPTGGRRWVPGKEVAPGRWYDSPTLVTPGGAPDGLDALARGTSDLEELLGAIDRLLGNQTG